MHIPGPVCGIYNSLRGRLLVTASRHKTTLAAARWPGEDVNFWILERIAHDDAALFECWHGP